MITKTHLLVSTFLLLSVSLATAGVRQTVQFTVKAVDEEGRPLSGVQITTRFAGERTEGATDTNGLFVVRANVLSREGGFVATKDGYYASRAKVLFPSIQDGRCQPWDSVVTTVVRRVINPIPMYAKRVDKKIPRENTPIGFDLVLGDWTRPYGTGQQPDLIFRFSRQVTSDTDYEGSLLLSFVNPLDGVLENYEAIPGSELRLPRNAPESGYATNWVYHVGQNATNGRFGCRGQGDDKSYFLRVRSKTDEKGQLKEALYGKVKGLIRVRGVARKGDADIIFNYYLNPTPNDRNLEFDPKRNLFQNLDEFETVSEP